jgi:transposase
MLLWEEYRATHGEGYAYSHYCQLYRDWEKTISPVMRQAHGPAEKLFVDFSGDTVPVFDAMTGEERRAHIFVAALGASNYTYAEARWTESLPDWLGAHANALTALDGVPHAVVCDNLKAGVTAICRYEPGINRSYRIWPRTLQPFCLPARTARQAKVGGIYNVRAMYWRSCAIALLLSELNSAIREIIARLNAKIMRKLGVSRRELFESIDRPALKPLPEEPYQYAEWKKCRVAPDYHVEIDGHYYSVQSRLIRAAVEARITGKTVEILHKGSRVASHLRSFVHHRHTTIDAHMPSAHPAAVDPARIMREAAKIGPATIALVERIMKAKPHPEQGFRACLGIMRLGRTYGSQRLEAACQRGNDIGAISYSSIASILKNGLDKAYAEKAPDAAPIWHGNIRGNGYYH